MDLWPDPLRIYYFLIMGEDAWIDMSPFQGFGRSWSALHWAMRGICTLPGDISERASAPEQIAIQRIAGLRPLIWFPLTVSALETLSAAQLPPCCVLFSGEPEVAARIDAWQEKIGFKALHITVVDGKGTPAENFDLTLLRDYCLKRLEEEAARLNEGQKELVADAAVDWNWPDVLLEDYDVKGHNVTVPNHMALARVGYTLKESVPFIAETENEYTDAIVESAASVALLRHEMGDHDIYALGAPAPGVILFEPALFRMGYRRVAGNTPEGAAFRKALRYFQQQKLLRPTLDPEGIKFFQDTREGRFVAETRSEELLTQTFGVGLLAAQTTSPVVRLSPGVNHVFPSLSAYARNVRAGRFEARRKATRLFSEIQEQLHSAAGDERIEFISRTRGPIKIISDAPIEWLPIDGLPLSFARDCSRIPVTPGNVMMGELLPVQPMSIPPEAFRKVLVISSFKEDDPLKDILSNALEAVRPSWETVVDLTQVRVSTVEQFVSALNDFDGEILIFDGHGVANASTPISTIAIGGERLDDWSLRGLVRCPPIVILSACDTHGIDASSHATVGNGFIALGARTVLGTFLPVDGLRSAMFVARLMHRVAEFIPAAIKAYGRSVTWTEVVSGMLRMCLATEVIIALVGPPGSATYNELQGKANYEINGHDPEWFEKLIERIAKIRDVDIEASRRLAQKVVARSDAIRYTQLGNPETIILSGDTVIESIMRARGRLGDESEAVADTRVVE
ncbi:CHAT domain-containing protein [Rhizobium leguminosarum]|uniref:CHAT domain-containing protein n=1 Tax=Rhizobium leguminosarum TaxID=384 RepID=A0A2K9ZFX2_RHILE|nr:CHAT domain-containing protein [Rhizobium leguminosarum]AUW47155.1 hypothetical protein CUJ84_pRLN3000013 [Rhizobium leguminosarum]